MNKQILILFLLTSCAFGVPRYKANSLYIGMHKSEVLTVMGQPYIWTENGVDTIASGYWKMASGPPTVVYFSVRTWEAIKIEADWAGYRIEQEQWRQAITGVSNQLNRQVERVHEYNMQQSAPREIPQWQPITFESQQ